MMKVVKKTGILVALLALGMVLGVLLVGPADIVQGRAADQGDPDIFVYVCIKRSGEAKIADSFDACQPNDQAIALTSADGYNQLLATILAEQTAREDTITSLQASQASLAAEVAVLNEALADEQAARIAAYANQGVLNEQLFAVSDAAIKATNEDKAYFLEKLARVNEMAKALTEYLNEINGTCFVVDEEDICPFQNRPPLCLECILDEP
jgi:hypothetical protein